MCGIFGILGTPGEDPTTQTLPQVTKILAHRGPDDAGAVTIEKAPEGYTVQRNAGSSTADHQVVGGLSHTRLSILDLSAAGHQPMANEGEDLWIVYNGEVYNFEELRHELIEAGHTFTSKSDTEVLLRGYDAWGRDLLPKLNGMFAFAILDLRGDQPELFLARDRMGQKPLYYARTEDGFAFASEMKALLEIPWVERSLDLEALNEYLTFLWVPEPRTMIQGIEKLPPGHWMRVTPDGLEMEPFWSYDLDDSLDGGEEELAEELRERLHRAFHRTTRSDVPVSAFLSGGLDSSAIVSVLARDGFPLHRVYTMATDTDDQSYEGFPDDASYAESLADALDLDQEISVMEPDLAASLPELVWYLDEPLADPAILPLHVMCERAKGESKVLLSGMGADELFGGYRRHAIAGLLDVLGRIPGSGLAARAANKLPSAGDHALAPTFRRIQRVTRAMDAEDLYVGVASWTTPTQRTRLLADDVLEHVDPEQAGKRITAGLPDADERPLLDRMLLGDARVYLPSHNLNYTDKISMGSSVEVRSPFLDNEILEFARQLPSRYKVQRGKLKHLLKLALEEDLPEEIIDRKKAGFGAPIRSWLTGPLDPLVKEVLSPERIAERGLFDPSAVEALKEDLREGREDTSYTVWALLILELWMDTFDVEVPLP